MSILQNSNAISAGGYDINNSLRFRSSATAYLSRTPSSSGNRQKWTWSGWVKRGALSDTMLFHCQISSTDKVQCRIDSNHNIAFLVRIGNVSGLLITSRVLRDPSAWYHIMFVCDTTQATATTQFKIYVNGVEETSFSSSSATTQNGNSAVNSTTSHQIGYDVPNASSAFDGYLAETYLVDGQALTPSSFGETDTTTGVWKPKAYTGTYGTNGFYLKFSDIATTSGSNAGLGKDFSGNSNYWTTNNISVTSGTTYDAMTDSPTLTSATVGNYAVLNPVNTNATLSSANLNYSSPSNAPAPAYSTIGMTSGKWYYEYQVTSTNCVVGVWGNGNAGMTTTYPTYYWDIGASSASALTLEKTSGTASGSLGNLASNDVYGIALDVDNTTIYFYKNNTLVQTITGMVFVGPLFFVCGSWSSGTSATGNANFGQRPFTYTPPTGYVALNTYNLPDSTIKKGNKYMDATLYTGNGYPTSGTQSITNAASFKPDFIWAKARSAAASHTLSDSVRGTNSQLFTNNTAAQETNTDYVTSFNSNGFSLGTGTSGIYGNINSNGTTYVAWQWQAGQGSTSSNTSGSITSTVSVNASAGFSIVTYTGNLTAAGNATVGHGLGVAPKMVITKRRSGTSQWMVWHTGLTNATYALQLQSTDAQVNTAGAGWLGGTVSDPTSTTFGTNYLDGRNINGSTYVAYCWAEIAGFSKFTSYTGNGSSDGPFIYCGFRPKFVIIKMYSGAVGQSWALQDTSRSTYNASIYRLQAESSNAENSSTSNSIDILSNGFKIRTTDNEYNNSSYSYIVAAFAENPFKNSLAR